MFLIFKDLFNKKNEKWLLFIIIIPLILFSIYHLSTYKKSFDDIVYKAFGDNKSIEYISIYSMHNCDYSRNLIEDDIKLDKFIKYMNSLKLVETKNSYSYADDKPFDSIFLENFTYSNSIVINFFDNTHILITTEHRDPPHQRVNSCTYELANGSIDYDYINSLFNK